MTPHRHVTEHITPVRGYDAKTARAMEAGLVRSLAGPGDDLPKPETPRSIEFAATVARLMRPGREYTCGDIERITGVGSHAVIGGAMGVLLRNGLVTRSVRSQMPVYALSEAAA